MPRESSALSSKIRNLRGELASSLNIQQLMDVVSKTWRVLILQPRSERCGGPGETEYVLKSCKDGRKSMLQIYVVLTGLEGLFRFTQASAKLRPGL